MHRINMPEFNGFDAVEKLIGGRGETGVLSNMLKEHAYCVLLLDEFEKADPKVHDLFLSILDEGTFVDGLDQKINARNTIIIATSNAGNKMILDWVDRGESLDNKEDALVHHIIEESAFKPELINRFDGVVIFEPLNTQQQGAIATAMLQSLQERIAEKGFTLEVTNELVQALVKVGYQPEFGARPMQRAIQDFVEEAVAKKILEGNLKKGSVISLSSGEIAAFKADR
jgi:ATP-dependent Clp protease ATP-binding subunit ClpA